MTVQFHFLEFEVIFLGPTQTWPVAQIEALEILHNSQELTMGSSQTKSGENVKLQISTLPTKKFMEIVKKLLKNALKRRFCAHLIEMLTFTRADPKNHFSPISTSKTPKHPLDGQ